MRMAQKTKLTNRVPSGLGSQGFRVSVEDFAGKVI